MRPLARGFAVCLFFASTLITLAPATVSAAPVLGFREEFPGPGVGGWAGGVPVANNPGTGGVLGPGDGYLYVQTTAPSNWGHRCQSCPEYTGSWSAAGITEVRLWLNDVGTAEPFEIHVLIGNAHNLWQYDTGFSPPSQLWGEFVVDVTNPADFTQTIGTQPFAEALDSVSILLVRHDKAPFLPNPNSPDPIAGDAGIDRILLTNGTVGVEPLPSHVSRSLQLAAPYPNPSRGSVTMAVRNPSGGAVVMEILDVTGRVLRREVLPTEAAGSSRWVWDGFDARGRAVPPGQYRVRAVGEAGGASRPFIVVD